MYNLDSNDYLYQLKKLQIFTALIYLIQDKIHVLLFGWWNGVYDHPKKVLQIFVR